MSRRTFRERRDDRPKTIAKDLSGRTPPHNLEAEAAVLSTVLSSGKYLDEILDLLPSGEAFFSDAHGRVYDVAVELHAAGQPIDALLVHGVLKERGRLEAVGGLSFISKLIDASPAIAHVRAHAQVVADKWRRRRVIELCQLAVADGIADQGDTQEFIDGHEQAVFDLGRSKSAADIRHISAAIVEATELAQRAHEGPGGITGFPTGFIGVDERTGGAHPTDLVVIGARPGMGKTAYVLGIASNLAEIQPAIDADGKLARNEAGQFIEPGYLVAMWSLEMPGSQFAIRLAAMKSGLDVSKVRRGRLGADYYAFMQHLENAKRLPIYVDEASGITVMDIRAKVRRLQREFPHKKVIAIIDYIQLMRGPDGVEREQAVSEITRGLKGLAKEMRIPVIALSQLNRDVEKRPMKDRRPVLSDLRESGSIEQDADVIQFLYRKEYYRKLAGEEVPDDERGYAEVITAKQRNGPTGSDAVAFRGASTRFENPSEDDFRRWGLDDAADEISRQPKMFAPGSKLPGASPRN